DLGDVAIHDRLRSVAEACEEHLHLGRCRVLRLIEDDERLVQRAAAKEREWRDLDLVALTCARESLGRHELVKRVVQRTEIRIDLLGEIAGEESQTLTGFDGGSREDEA